MTAYSENTFEDIKHFDVDGSEFWYARELQTTLEYSEWRNFLEVVNKAKAACRNTGITISSCFVDVNKTSSMPRGGVKIIKDITLNRYACYLIVLNGDPNKEIIALGQTYFAVQTRKQELSESEKFEELSDDERPLQISSSVNVLKRMTIFSIIWGLLNLPPITSNHPDGRKD